MTDMGGSGSEANEQAGEAPGGEEEEDGEGEEEEVQHLDDS